MIPKRTLLSCGEVLTTDQALVYFGNRESSLEVLKVQFPEFNFQRTSQKHGTIIFAANIKTVTSLPEADAHWTNDNKLGLCINTADCIPAFIFDPVAGCIAAVHAGWRGVRDQILKKTIMEITKNCASRAESLLIFIGPHIQFNSFEVENTIRDELNRTVENSADCHKISNDEKSFVNLGLLVCRQLEQLGVRSENIFSELQDTKTDLSFYSYRRDRSAAGRQISFIAKTN